MDSSSPHLLDARSLRAAFLDLHGRPPLAVEREVWLGRKLDDLVAERVGDQAFWAAWLEEQLYYFLLINNFRPRSERVLELPGLLAKGAIHAKDALWRIALSPSFDQRNPGADTFVTVVMEQLDGIVVQKNTRELEIGKAAYDGGPGLFLGTRVGSQSDVVAAAIDDKRFASHFVEREHLRLLRRVPDKKAGRAWTSRFRKEPAEMGAIYAEWMTSAAWLERLELRRPLSNRAWVKSVFVDLFDRLPDGDEARRMRDALDGLSNPRPLRSLLVRLLIDGSGDERPKLPDEAELEDESGWVRSLFPLLLGREATADEARVFVHTLRREDCSPATLYLALLTSAAYQED
jgi:hypothetical protein